MKKFLHLTFLLTISCASMKGYFNTFYNAEDYFRKAEKLRQGNNGLLDKNSQNLYEWARFLFKSLKIDLKYLRDIFW